MRRTEEDLERIRSFLEQRRNALMGVSTASVFDADIAFHCAVAEAAGNEVLTDLYRAFALSFSPCPCHTLGRRGLAATKSLLDRHDTALAKAEANQASNVME